MGWEAMGYISLINKLREVFMKLKTEGGFSSKLRIESLIEIGNEARTHRPSPSSIV